MSSNHSRSIRDPPPMSEPYTEWKEEVYIWSEYVMDKTPLEKQGLALFLSLNGDARKAASKVKLAEMKKAEGLQTVLKELDKFFLKDIDREAFLSYDKFHEFKRPAGMPMKDFLIKFELLRNTCTSHKIEIADKIVAYQMLRAANLPTMQQELVKTTLTTFSSDNMRSQILKIFSEDTIPENSSCSTDIDQFHVKSEVGNEDVNVTLYGSSGNKSSNRNRSRRNYKRSQRDNDRRRQSSPNEPTTLKRNHPLLPCKTTQV